MKKLGIAHTRAVTPNLRIAVRCLAIGLLTCLAAIVISATRLAHGSVAAKANLSVGNYLQEMSPGLNLGNTLEAIPTETSWGNPQTTEAFFKAVRSAGFRSVRIPVSWSQYADAKHQIRPDWLAHVTDVVRMAIRSRLYVVINIHWDGGWMQPTQVRKEAVSEKLSKFWTQIATNFRDFDDHLLFALADMGIRLALGADIKRLRKIEGEYNAFIWGSSVIFPGGTY